MRALKLPFPRRSVGPGPRGRKGAEAEHFSQQLIAYKFTQLGTCNVNWSLTSANLSHLTLVATATGHY